MNISINSEDIKLYIEENYWVIDALYLDDIAKKMPSNIQNVDEFIRRNLFPYNQTPFAYYLPKKEKFSIKQIKQIEYNSINENNKRYLFSTDTGLILFVNQGILFDFIKHYDYDTLVDSPTEIINFTYLNSISSRFREKDVALILADTNNGYDFNGSGLYKIL